MVESPKKKYYGLRGKKLQLAVATVAGMGFLLFGYDQGVMGGLLTLDRFLNQFPRMKESSSVEGITVAIYEIGCWMGALTAMNIGDIFGRRKMIFGGGVIMIIGAILQCSSFSLAQLIVGRIVTGVGNGFITSTVPMWQSECARPDQRGKLVMVEGALITCGIMISYWIDLGFSFVDNSANWRFPLAFQICFALFLLAFVLGLPESPRWLIRKDRVFEARQVFAALEDISIDHHLIESEVEEIIATLQVENLTRSPLRRIFTFDKERHFHRAMLAFWNQAFQQISGINLITYYAATLFENSIGLSGLNSRIVAACNGTEYFAASWIAYFTIENIGRRKLMLFGAAGQAITMGILTATVWDAQVNGNSSSAIAAAVFLFVFNTFFAIGWLGMTWLYPAEIVALEIRAPSNGLSTSANWIFNFMVVMITPVGFSNIKYYTYTVFAALNAVIFVATYFFYPETAGRSLEEIDRIFEKSNPWTPWDVVQIAYDLPHHNAYWDEEHGIQREKGQGQEVESSEGFGSTKREE